MKDEINAEGARAAPTSQPSTRRRYMTGWRCAVVNYIVLVSLILAINIGVSAWVGAHYGFRSGLGTLASNKCSKIQRANVAIHLVINALATALLSGSNYCMQCLSAPTRKDLDRAHSNGQYVEIGVPSFHNLTKISRRKMLSWILLFLSSLPLHLL